MRKKLKWKEFETFAIRLNPDTMIYEPDDLFDLDAWREEVSGSAARARRTFSPSIVQEVLESGHGTDKKGLGRGIG